MNFINWTALKYTYRYDGINTRAVKKGEIYYCDLGENIGSEQSKKRPVIILQNDTGNKYSSTTIVAPIINSPKTLPVHIPIKKVMSGLQTTGVIRLEHIREIAKCRLGIFVEKIDIKSSGWKNVERGIKISLDIK
ncbi:type II toxin-antitoxin system PemK/MazF family toxin [Natronospora cellulosivora (SeqCode)]